MRLRAALFGVLVLTVVAVSCGGDDGGDSSKSASTSSTSTTSTTAPSASTTPTTAPGRPEGTYDGVTWKVVEKPDANGTCQTIQLGGRPTDFAGNDEKVCVPVPSRDSVDSDPIELVSGTDQSTGGAPVFIAGFSAPEIVDVQVSTADGPAAVTRWPSGGFIAWSRTPAQTITYTLDTKPHTCAVEWNGGNPKQRCEPAG
jgi:hypothetical protein